MKLLYYLLFFCGSCMAQEVDIYFDFNKYDINMQAKQTLQLFTQSHKDALIVELRGYCDHVGSDAYNDTLAMKRIRAVQNALRELQFNVPDKTTIKSYGERFEQLPEQSANRKVSIVYKLPEKVAVKSELSEFRKSTLNAKVGYIIKLPGMNFFNNSAKMLPKSVPTLEELLCILEENPNLQIEIQGHICCQKERDVNDVSTARARAVFNYLIQKGINRKRLTYKGYGISKPIHKIPEKSELEEEENRRVEIRIVKI